MENQPTLLVECWRIIDQTLDRVEESKNAKEKKKRARAKTSQ